MIQHTDIEKCAETIWGLSPHNKHKAKEYLELFLHTRETALIEEVRGIVGEKILPPIFDTASQWENNEDILVRHGRNYEIGRILSSLSQLQDNKKQGNTN